MKNLEVFNEVRNKLNNVVEANKGFKINGVEDKEGYVKVKQAKKEIRDEEISLERLAKSERQEALEYQRGIIALEKDLKKITSPVIKDYDTQLKEIDELIAIEERKVLLPDRIEKLKAIELVILDDNYLLSLDEKQFAEYYNEKQLAYLQAKEDKRLETERKVEDDKRIEQFKKEAVDKAIKEVNDNVEIEKRKQEEEDDKKAKKILQEPAEKEAERVSKLEDEKVQTWLKENNYNKEDYKLFTEGNKMVLYKKVSEFNN